MTQRKTLTLYQNSSEGFDEYPKAVLIASIDESMDYEIDQTSIYANGKRFLLATATGCSCWDGDWEVAEYRSLKTLFNDIGPLGDSASRHNPTFEGVKTLRQQVDEYYQG